MAFLGHVRSHRAASTVLSGVYLGIGIVHVVPGDVAWPRGAVIPDRLDSGASLLLSHRLKPHVVDGGRRVVRTTRWKP
jgi:hypothetical protein